MSCLLSLNSWLKGIQGLPKLRSGPGTPQDNTLPASHRYSRGVFSEGTPTVLLHLLGPVDRKHAIWVNRHQNTADIGLLMDSVLSDKVIETTCGPLIYS